MHDACIRCDTTSTRRFYRQYTTQGPDITATLVRSSAISLLAAVVRPVIRPFVDPAVIRRLWAGSSWLIGRPARSVLGVIPAVPILAATAAILALPVRRARFAANDVRLRDWVLRCQAAGMAVHRCGGMLRRRRESGLLALSHRWRKGRQAVVVGVVLGPLGFAAVSAATAAQASDNSSNDGQGLQMSAMLCAC